ncbi:MAG: vacuolar family H+-ATPase subunit H [Clostridium sp.]|jgi:cell division septum initiation protein DivIVA|nr:vacuolar family H+-ATPase subunit H [Clostridium sp.]
MNSRIEQLIAEIEEFIGQCKYQTFSTNKIIVNKDKMDELLRELRLKTPDEIKRYQKIISNKEAILNDAREKAEALITEATVHTNQLVNEHEIMQQAYAQANEVVSMASFQAQGILDGAIIEANSVRTAATQYLEDVLTHLENIIGSATNAALTNYESLIGSLNQYHDIIQSNLKELHPVDEFEDVVDLAPDEGVKSDIDVIAGGVS